MKLDLSPDLTDFVNALADKNGMTPEAVIQQIIQTEMNVVEAKVGRITAKVNLAAFDRTKFISHYDQGREARKFFGIDDLDARKGPFVVHVPDDHPAMSMKFFSGLFDQSLMVHGPNKFREHYVFDADVGNLVLIDRMIRVIWEKVKDTELFRISVTTVGESDANYCVWLKIRDEISLAVYDEVDVGDYDTRGEALAYVEERAGRVVEDIF